MHVDAKSTTYLASNPQTMKGRLKEMTKQEIINSTEYTEKELTELALTMAAQQMKNFRNKSNDSESWEHYDNLYVALSTMLAEMKASEQ